MPPNGDEGWALFEENYVKKIYPQCIKGKLWSAIQVTTASSLCAVADLVLRRHSNRGFVAQESFHYKTCSRIGLEPATDDVHRGDIEGLSLSVINGRWQHGDPLVGLWRELIAAGIRESGDQRDDYTDSCCSADDYEHIVRESIAAFQAMAARPGSQAGGTRPVDRRRVAGAKGPAWSLGLRSRQDQSEGDGEVQEMIDMADFAVGQSRMLLWNDDASERAQHRMSGAWHPLGPVGVITAFNFPVAVWAWKLSWRR